MKSHSGTKPIDIEPMTTLAEIARRHAADRPRSTALSFEGRQTSYAQLDQHANQVAHGLARAGVRAGERVAYLGKNCDRYFEILFGAAKAGAVLTPIGWRLAPAEAAEILADSAARLVFVGPDGLAQASAALALLGDPPPMIAIDPAAEVGDLVYDVWRRMGPKDEPPASVRPDDVVVQLYTSGTTGRPKGVMLTHANLLAKQRDAARAQLDWHGWAADDVSLVAMPVAHVGGTLWGTVGLLYGVKCVVAREFNPLTVLDFIERDRISKMFMVPSALQIVVRQPRSRKIDYSRLKYILYGASPIPLELLRECMEVFACGFCQQYGLTETTGAVAYLPPEDHDPNGNPKMRSAGRPMPGVELRIVDAEGLELPTGQVGEVAVRSISNMAGYWRRPEETAATLGADGWLRTGDAGYLDGDGYLYIHDRVKDMIISGAENIYPAEVENAIYGHPGVADVAVIGVPDDTWGEAVKAVVVLKPGMAVSADEIVAFARGRIASFKAPKSVDFVDDLPRNASGKVLRRALRERYWTGRRRKVN
jgi:long-chain acyl-CoA synthetase